MALVCALGAAFASPQTAAADEDERAFSIGAKPIWYLLGGVNAGGTIAIADRGALVGGEVSLVRVRQRTIFGLYADGYYDFGTDGTYVSVGPEIGKGFVGIDAGGALRFAQGETQLGATGRLFLSAGIVSVYARYAYFDAEMDDHVVQLGLLIKMPLWSPFGFGDI